MPIKKRSVIKAFARVPMPASRAFCFVKFTPFFALFFGRVFWVFERQIWSRLPKFKYFYFVAANLRPDFRALVSARPPLAPSYPADLAPLINGALVAAELIYFLGAIFKGSAVFVCFWLRTRLRWSIIFVSYVFSSSLLALDLSPAPYRYQGVSKNRH